jgi:hypothetical protein
MRRRNKRPDRLEFDIRRQPDDMTCGPTCLHAVYRFLGDEVPFAEVRESVQSMYHGGTLAVLLAHHALKRGYKATLITWNLQVFDPTWFEPGAAPLRELLLRRADMRPEEHIRQHVATYVDFLDEGGSIVLRDLDPKLLRGYLRRGLPVLTGLSSTFLYREAREDAATSVTDDIGGDPSGHFVVLTGYLPGQREVLVSDPMHPNPLAVTHTYPVPMLRLIGAIYLGVLTHDANMLVIEPRTTTR